MNPNEIELALIQGGPVAASVAFVLLAVKAWKTETFSSMLGLLGNRGEKLKWTNLQPAQKTGVSVLMTIITSLAQVLLGASPATAIMGAIATFAGAQATYTTAEQIKKPKEPKVYEPSPSRPSSLITKPPSGPNG